MYVREMSETALIKSLVETAGAQEARLIDQAGNLGFCLRLSAGDDAAAWEGPEGTRVLTTDAMVEGTHFDLAHIGWTDLGWKSLAVNLSDVAAMGCAPLCSVVTLGLRGDLPVDGLVEMYTGMLDASRQYGGAVVGGDIVRSPVFFVAISMVGAAQYAGGSEPKRQPLLMRSAATQGEKVAVLGHVGCAGGGLRMLRDGLRFNEQTADHLRNAHNRPVPRVAQGMLLVRHGVVAAIDISDGLVDDLGKLCEASGVGALIYADQVPADDFLRRSYPDDWLSMALSAGEDYELLFTAPPDLIDEVASSLDVPVAVIGEIVDEPAGVTVLDSSGKAIPVERGGWDHFRQAQRSVRDIRPASREG